MVSRNPTVGELVYTKHPNLPILEPPVGKIGFLTTGRTFTKGTHAIVVRVKKHMGELIFTDGTTGWCNLCLLEVIQ